MTPIRKTQQQRLQRAQARKRTLRKVAGIFLLLAGAVWGLQQLPWQMWLAALQPAPASPEAVSAPQQVQLSSDKAQKVPEQRPVQFTFYETLPKMAVKVDVDPLPVRLEQPVVIVAGTFREAAAAQRELARLQQRGFEQIGIRVFENGGHKLYQLRSHPLDNKLDVIKLKNRLQKAGARVLVVKLPKSEAQN